VRPTIFTKAASTGALPHDLLLVIHNTQSLELTYQDNSLISYDLYDLEKKTLATHGRKSFLDLSRKKVGR